jgi:beta-glucosidase
MIEAIYTFPSNFLWGTATSSHQVEGDNSNNDWWLWEQEEGRIRNGHRSGKACDWWAGRWDEDFDRAVADGQNAHRLSLEWSRIEPKPGLWDPSAMERYREIIKGAIDRGLTPMVTLHHFTNPIWLVEQGGWLADEIVEWFERYTRFVVGKLADLVKLWITINEPNVYGYEGFLAGAFPPGDTSLGKLFQVTRNMVLAHAAAYHAIHEIQAEASVGVAHHYRGMKPAHPGNPLDRWVARYRSRVFNDSFPRAVSTGDFHFLGRRETLPQAVNTQDFFGLNYYTLENVSFDLRKPTELFTRGFFPPDADLSPDGFIANEPAGMWNALRWAHAFGLPIFVTENGVEDADDQLRPRYLASHVREVWRAVNFNWYVRGYFFWSLVDNFEWERGWTQRFGLWELDVDTQERKRRSSADFYAEICKANGLSTEMVARFAPRAFGSVFPGASLENREEQSAA